MESEEFRDAGARTRWFRAEYRAQRVPGGYAGGRHLAAVLVVGTVGVVALLSGLPACAWWEWLALPAGAVVANVVEYAAHRWVMHRPRPSTMRIYRRHARDHHRFFTRTAMRSDDARDYELVLSPLRNVLLFMTLFAAPALGLALLCLPAAAARLFAAALVAYYVLYEVLHLAYHATPHSPLGRLPGVAALRRLHADHHDPARMGRYNFNISLPLGDLLFGTRWRG